jgi:signal transduction histidine kinase
MGTSARATLVPHLVDVDTLHPGPLTRRDFDRLLEAIEQLSAARDLLGVMAVVRTAARELTGADGVTFVLREGNLVHYADENAIAPLWKGRRFPASICISGWAIEHRQTVVIDDVSTDPRIPQDVYRATFVRSLAMVPIRVADPLGAIGVYWASRHEATPREVELIEKLAATTAVALSNAYLNAQLQEAICARDDFLAMASHELKTPLTPAVASVHLIRALATHGQLSPEAIEPYIDMADTALGRLQRLVNDLLEVAQLPRGGLKLERTRVDLAQVVDEVLAQQLGMRADGVADVTVEVRRPASGHWDEARIRRVVTHLVGNAIKHGRGSPVQVTLDVVEGAACLRVQDHGPGIRPEDQERIFERFQRAASSATIAGFGLGLWLVREIIEAHGGRVTTSSTEDGAGATFEVYLPLA